MRPYELIKSHKCKRVRERSRENVSQKPQKQLKFVSKRIFESASVGQKLKMIFKKLMTICNRFPLPIVGIL